MTKLIVPEKYIDELEEVRKKREQREIEEFFRNSKVKFWDMPFEELIKAKGILHDFENLSDFVKCFFDAYGFDLGSTPIESLAEMANEYRNFKIMFDDIKKNPAVEKEWNKFLIFWRLHGTIESGNCE